MNNSLPKVRRTNREVIDDQEIKSHLTNMPFGFIASSNNGQPFLNSNLFYYDQQDETIYFHTVRNSHTEKLFMANNKTCFSVASMGRLLPAKEALNFSTEYLSVVVFGTTEIVVDEQKIMFVFKQYFKKYFPVMDMASVKGYSIEDANRAVVFAMKITSWTCKMNSVTDDIAESFFYRDHLDPVYESKFGKFVP